MTQLIVINEQRAVIMQLAIYLAFDYKMSNVNADKYCLSNANSFYSYRTDCSFSRWKRKREREINSSLWPRIRVRIQIG